ncbi:porin [Azospirillum melinis]|uniref:Porin n=1 Tax=Azospirillum melinis TaxID=328839 RepID=A0ABX2KR09_9PROT|nr:porin [Azospirillum melinis]MBP2310293.1 putative porin [Azospirillum melinis]NUB02304.1 porin [Azospirillum melinis]
MTRYLLAGAAAAALALGAGAANAQAKFEVKIGGDAYFEAGYVDQDLDSGLRSTEFRNRMRINIIPSAKADNGLEYGARMRLRANAGTNNARNTDADRAYIFAQGSFGQVRLGVTNSFNDETYTTAPLDYLPLGIYDALPAWIGTTANGLNSGAAPTVTNGNTIITQSLVAEANSTKIVYFSPRFAGLQIGASYTPRNDSSATDVNRVKPVGTFAAGGAGTYTDIVEVGANYNNTFGGVTVKASAGYNWGRAVDDVVGSNYKDLNAWQAGAQVGYAGFAIGGGYIDYGKSGQNKRPGVATENTRNWVVGAQYTAGPIVVGANYKNGKDAGSFFTAGDRELQVYEIGVGYTVAPGLTVQAQYDHFKLDNDASLRDDKGDVVLVRSILAF